MVDGFSNLLVDIVSSRSVRCAVLFGSYARSLFLTGRGADYLSDVDLHCIVDSPKDFENRMWLPSHLLDDCGFYCIRAVSGGAKKVSMVLDGIHIDIVIVGVWRMFVGRMLLSLPGVRSSACFMTRLNDLSDVMRYGHLVVKGGQGWARFYRYSAMVGGRLFLSDRDAERLVDNALAESERALAKLARGERISGLRILHNILLEGNLRLLNEIRERSGLKALHRGRRVECILNQAELVAISSIGEGGGVSVAIEIQSRMEDMLKLYSILSDRS